jgi:hypothetical protein
MKILNQFACSKCDTIFQITTDERRLERCMCPTCGRGCKTRGFWPALQPLNFRPIPLLVSEGHLRLPTEAQTDLALKPTDEVFLVRKEDVWELWPSKKARAMLQDWRSHG